MAKALENNKSLHSIYLRSNDAQDQGAIALAHALKEDNRTLKNLYLGNNNITPVGVEALANVLSFNTTLEVLSFRNNQVGDKGCTALANNLEINATLKTLNLANTEIGDDGALRLLQILAVNTNLVDINLNYSEVEDEEILEKIKERLQYNGSQNVVAVNAIARKILSYCEEYLSQEDVAGVEVIPSEEFAKSHALAKEDLYYLSGKNKHGGAILCLASLFRMALNKYHEEAVDMVLQAANDICGILFSCVEEEMSNAEIAKPNEKIMTIVTNALKKIKTPE